MKKTAIALSLLGAIATTQAFADNHSISPFSETAVSVGFSSTEIDDLDATLTGFALSAGYQFDNGVYLKQTMLSASDDLTMSGVDIDLELDVLTTSGGIQFLQSEKGLFYAEAAYFDAEAEANGIAIDDSELALTFGTKRMLMDKLVGVVEVEHVDSQTSLIAELQYNFTQSVAVTTGVQFNEDGNSYGVNLKWFPNW